MILKPVRAVRALSAGRALLLAGLFCLQSSGLLADLPPARSVAPAAQPTPEVRWVDLTALKEQSAAMVKEQAERVEEQARRLSRTAATLGELQSELKAQSQASKNLDNSVVNLDNTLGTLDKRLIALNEAVAVKNVEAVSQASRLKNLADEMQALKLAQEGSAKQVREGLAEISALREDLKQRQGKLDSLTDLLTVIKKDVDANSEEIVEVKQSLKLYDQAPKKQADEGGEWWDQALRWKYLPAVAVTLSVLAVGLAASKK